MIFLYWRKIYPAPGRKVFPTGEEKVPPPMNAPFLTDEERGRHRREKLL